MDKVKVIDEAASQFVQQNWTSYATQERDEARVTVFDASGLLVRTYTAPWRRLRACMRHAHCSFCGAVQVEQSATTCTCGAFLVD